MPGTDGTGVLYGPPGRTARLGTLIVKPKPVVFSEKTFSAPECAILFMVSCLLFI